MALYQILVWKYEVTYLFQSSGSGSSNNNTNTTTTSPYVHPLFEYFDILLLKKGQGNANTTIDASSITASPTASPTAAGTGVMHRLVEIVKPHVTTTNVVSCAIILYKLMDWWSRSRVGTGSSSSGNNNNSSDRTQSPVNPNTNPNPNTSSSDIPVPPCPEYSIKPDDSIPISNPNPNPNPHCPICKLDYTLRKPTATSGGIVYCYQCIVKAIRIQPLCPLTKVSCLESDLIQLK